MPPAQQPGDLATPAYIRHENRSRVIVFVHGLSGDGKRTWTTPDGRAYWPALMRDDPAFNDCDIYVADYPTDKTKSRNLEIEEAADHLSQFLKRDRIFESHDKVIFIAHSMGGLVVRSMLLRDRPDPGKVPLLYFFGTPTEGSALATAVSPIIPNPEVRQMKAVTDDDIGPLWPMEGEWRKSPYSDRTHTISYCAYEKLTTSGHQIVSRSSASALCDQTTPIMADHDGIVQPASRDDAPYVFFLNAYHDVFEPHRAAAQSAPRTMLLNVALAAEERHVTAAAISPDGQTVIYVPREPDGHWSIWTVSSGDAKPRKLYESKWPILDVAISAGRQIYFTATAPQFSFYGLSPAGEATLMFDDQVTAFALSPDGKKIVFPKPVDFDVEVVVRNVDGSERTSLFTKPGTSFLDNVSWSPDGRSLLFVDQRGVFSFDIEERRERRILPGEPWRPTVTWSSDGRYLLSSQSKGVLRRIAPDGTIEGIANTQDTSFYGLAPAARPNVFFGRRGRDIEEVFIQKLSDDFPMRLPNSAGGSIEWTPDGSLLYGCADGGICESALGWTSPKKTAGVMDARVTPDRKSIVLETSSPAGKRELAIVDRTTNGIRILTRGDVMPGPFAISSDSHWIAYNSSGSETERAGTYRVSTDGKEREFLVPEYSKAYAFADGDRVLYFLRSAPFGELWRYSLTTHTRASTGIQLVEDFVLSHDGKTLACAPVSSSINYPVILVDAQSGTEMHRVPMPNSRSGHQLAWSADDRALYYTSSDALAENIFSVPVGGGEPRRITNYPEGSISRIATSPDGQEIAFVRGVHVDQPVFLTIN